MSSQGLGPGAPSHKSVPSPDVSSPLHDAVLGGNVNALTRLLSKPCDPNALRVVEYFGAVPFGGAAVLESAECTPLMLAAAMGYPALMRELLAVADATTRNGAGMSALTFAARGGHALCIRMLLHGEGATMAAHEHETALLEAARHQRHEALGLLLPHSRAAQIDWAFTEAIRAQSSGVVLALRPRASRGAIDAAMAELIPFHETEASLGTERSRVVRQRARDRITRILQTEAFAAQDAVDRAIPTIGGVVGTNGVVPAGLVKAASVV